MSSALLTILLTAPGVQGQGTASLDGRITDESTGDAIADAFVILDGIGRGTMSNTVGLFEFPDVPAGAIELRVRHVAYGEFQETLTVAAGSRVSLRITLSPTAIQIDPVVVEAEAQRSQGQRARGTAFNEVTRDEIEAAIQTSQHLAYVLERNITGVVIRADQGGDATNVCLEFRAPRSLSDPNSCKSPTVFIDGVRITNPRPIWGTFPLEDVERVEVVPSAEAGTLYGTDSNYGVVLIETRTGRDVTGAVDAETGLGPGTYDWVLESVSYPWAKVFLSSFVGNALGFTAGVLVGSQCLNYDGLSNAFFESSCGGFATAGATAALYGLPLTGATLATGWAGRTDLSHGRPFPTAIAGALALVPGTLLVAASDDEAFAGANVIGWVAIGIGVPLFTTIADRLFRRVHSDPFAAIDDGVR